MLKRQPVIFSIFIYLLLFSCTSNEKAPDLVPEQLCTAPNYWCTWYWQNYLIKAGEPVTNPSGKVYSNPAARENMNYETILGKNGMARVMLPKSRGEYYFLIDHGWQDKSIKKNTFFTFIMDPNDFPEYADLEPKDRIKKLNEEIKALGWRGLGLWVRGTPTQEDARKFVEWSKYAGVEYWKIDGGDTQNFRAFKAKNELYPELKLEYVTGSGGPLNTRWNQPNLSNYPSVYAPGEKQVKDANAGPGFASHALEVIKNSDVFRTYDAVPLLVSTVTLQRIHDILKQTAGHPEYISTLNIQDDCNIAAALGCLVAVKRHPMKTPRLYEGRDLHFQIAGDRHVDKRLNEMDRLVRWQRIAPPMPAGYGTYKASEKVLIDKFKFRVGDTWKEETWGKMVTQGAPAIIARNMALPKVECIGEPPYVLASRFPNGAICIGTEGRVKPGESWYYPKADVTAEVGALNSLVGIFGYYASLTLVFENPVPQNAKIWAQDLLATKATNISDKVKIDGNSITIPGKLIEAMGTSENDEGDISAPGLVLQIKD